MSESPSRRILVAGAAASVIAAPRAAAGDDRLGRIESSIGGRLGLAALDTTNGAMMTHRAAERFAMCSTFKAMAVAALLAKVDRGAERLDRFVRFGRRDLLAHAPVSTAALETAGGMAVSDLCAAAIEQSDNTAANLILKAIDGPPGWTRFVRTLGDEVSRLDRIELALNTALPGDPRDTTTPLAMLADLRLVALGKVLSQTSRERLTGWMSGCQTGLARLRAGVPSSWPVGDKTGTGERGAGGDIAVVYAPKGPIVIAAYIAGAERASAPVRDAAFAEIGRIVVETFRPLAADGAHG